MTDKTKEVFQQAVEQIHVPKSDVRRALNLGIQAEPVVKKKRFSLWIEIGVVIAAIASVLLLLRFTALKPEERANLNESTTTISSIEPVTEIDKWGLTNNNWRSEMGTFFSFSASDVQIQEIGKNRVVYTYVINGDTLQLLDSSGVVQATYDMVQEEEAIILTAIEAPVQVITLHPLIVKVYTEADIATLEPAVTPDLTAHEWIMEVNDDWGFNTLTFDATMMRNNPSGPSSEVLGTYFINGDEIQLNYDAMGGLQANFRMYWDGDVLVFWPSDANDHKEERQMVLEPKE